MSKTADSGGEREKHRDSECNVDPRILEILVCPLTKTALEYRRDTHELVSRAAGLAFPIRSGVPIMIVDAARRLDDADLARR